ncbi:hypothetical protein PACTADRAFT_49004 [Pachysolen tannophilus NRRL Y-2460]|uniref:Chloride channel protein n=1 Tax=Pachysolen tannophilus NRRL Y-2460 TaxID=669874 RepID=A0A1E4TZT5_PACTA|nr:hypothetical protein PACTADRAFT_49004 [Pachysolen tannophilus NRRL Y-2460]
MMANDNNDNNNENKTTPLKRLLDITYNQSLRSPRINNNNNNNTINSDANNDYFTYQHSSSNTNNIEDPTKVLMRYASVPSQLSIRNKSSLRANYGSIENHQDSIHSQNDNANGPNTNLERNFYDDFTTVDWLQNSIKQSERLTYLNKKSKKSFKYKIFKNIDQLKSWVLILIISFCCSLLAYSIDKVENVLVDLKRGYCSANWLLSESTCCSSKAMVPTPPEFWIRDNNIAMCKDFKMWSDRFYDFNSIFPLEFSIYVALTLILAFAAVRITLLTKTINPLRGKDCKTNNHRIWYTAYGSGVPEVKTILSGFIIRKFLGTWTLLCKSTALVLAIASGMALGKEGPYVHLSTCIGNICCRLFTSINTNELEKRQILSAAAGSGVALAFGSPLGGVLFVIEEVAYYLPINQLFHIFFCAISSVLFLKFLNPYETGKTVIFEVHYNSDWEPVELIFYIILGVAGGIFGACFCLFTQWWNKFFRKNSLIKHHPVREVLLIALVTGLTTYYNKYSKTPTTELLYKLASPCTIENKCSILEEKQLSDAGSIVIIKFGEVLNEIRYLSIALIIKIFLTSITFGIKLPAGIYVPSMVIGALFGRLFAMIMQYFVMLYPSAFLFSKHLRDGETYVDLGIFAMIGAGAFMAGVTRMNVTLATILFELTSSYTYVLPISIAIAVSNWIANMIEPRSLYEILIDNNDFPILDNRNPPVFENNFTTAKDLLMDDCGNENLIVRVDDGYFPASKLKLKLNYLKANSLIDGCLPIIAQTKKLKKIGDVTTEEKDQEEFVGLISLPDLELRLDKIDEFISEYNINEEIYIKLIKDNDDAVGTNADVYSIISSSTAANNSVHEDDTAELIAKALSDLTNFVNVIDYNPILISDNSKLSYCYFIFSKLGNREIAILNHENGQFMGILYKKILIDYCKKMRKK